jgi:hypothetical protein
MELIVRGGKTDPLERIVDTQQLEEHFSNITASGIFSISVMARGVPKRTNCISF